MDLFRRIFGGTGEEVPPEQPEKTPEKSKPPSKIQTAPGLEEKVAEESKTESGDTKPLDDGVTSEGDAPQVQDPATRPVGPPPPPPNRKFVPDGVTQPLNANALSVGRTEHITIGLASDVGMVRNNNQDAAFSMYCSGRSADDLPDLGLFVVADGMGGHNDGEKASAITTRTLASKFTKQIYMPIFASDNEDADQQPTTEALIEAVHEANREVLRYVPEGGTTITAIAIIGDLAHIVHVGDSRAYIMTKEGGIEQLTRDHSLVQRLIELDQLTPEEAEIHPQKNVLYRALGQNETLEVDTSSRRLPAGSNLLICSDGLWGLVEEEELYDITTNNVDPQQACDKLVALANTRGGADNITAIILKIS